MSDPILVTLIKMQPHNSQSRGVNATPSSDSCPVSLLLGRKSPPRGGRWWTSGLACKGVFCSTDDDTFFNKNNAIPPSWKLNLTDSWGELKTDKFQGRSWRLLLFFTFFALLFCIQDGGPDLFVSVTNTTATSGVVLKLQCSSPRLYLPERALCAS